MARSLYRADSDYLEALDLPGLPTAVPLTIAFWFRVRSVAATSIGVFVGDGGAGSADGFAVNLSSLSVVNATTSAAGTNSTAATTATFAVGEWHHAVGFFQSATARYSMLDGTLSAINSTSRTPSGVVRVWVGHFQNSGTHTYADIEIAEVGIWNVDIGEAAGQTLAACSLCDKVRPDALVGYWPMDERDLGGVCINRAPRAGGRGNLIPMTPGALRSPAHVVYQHRPPVNPPSRRTFRVSAGGGAKPWLYRRHTHTLGAGFVRAS